MAEGTVLAEIVLDGDKQFRAAIDKAGESMEAAGDEATGLSARLDRVAEGMSDLVAPATLAGNRVDNLGDQLSQTGRKAAAATAGIVGYSSASSGAAGTSATWSAVMSASLIPALGALSLTLGPLVATLGAVAAGAGALAAVFGTVIGSGLLAYGRELASTMPDVEKPTEALAKRFGELRSEIADIIAPLGEAFVPLIRAALNALPGLVRSIVDTLGPLDQFAQTLRSMGQQAMDIIPQITAAMFDLARRALPVFQDFVSFIASRGPQAFNLLLDSFRETRDEFALLLGATVSALPPLLELGNTVARILVPAVAGAVSVIGSVVDRFNELPQPLRDGAVAAGLLGSAFVVAVPAVTAIAGAISALLGPLGAAVIAISALAGAVQANFGGIRTSIELALSAIRTEFEKTFPALKSLVTTVLSDIAAAFGIHGTNVESTVGEYIGRVTTIVLEGLPQVGQFIRQQLRSLEATWTQHSDDVQRIVGGLTDFIQRNPAQALATLATVIVPGPLGTIVAAFRDNWNQAERTVRTAMATITDVAQTMMQSFKRQIINPAQDSQMAFSRNLTRMLAESQQTFQTIRDIVGRVMNTVFTNIRERLRSMKRIWIANLSGSDGILANTRTAFNSLWNNIIKPTLTLIQAGWRVFGDDLIRIFDGVLGTLNTVASIGFDLLLTSINVILDLISGDWEGAWTNIKNFFQRTWNTLTDWAKTDGKQLLVGAWNIIIDATKAQWSGFWDWLIGNSFFPDLINAVADWLTSTGKSLIKGAFDTIVGGIEGALNSIDLSDITTALEDIVSTAGDALDAIDSIPSSVSSSIDLNIKKNFLGGNEDDDNDGDDGGGGGGGSNPGAGVSEDDDGTSGTSGSGGGGSNNSFAGYTDDSDTGGDSSGSDLYGGSDAPGLAHGGLTQGEGLAYLHPNEVVMGVETGARALAEELDAGGETRIVFEEGAIQTEDPEAAADLVEQRLERRLKRLSTR
ncbi:hypothetical protein [Haloarcula sp. 1CSR25-25]|uniref:hypothetical protein n=1 Tax=Haloarcula sp. 1CSR25-25 TaxID=2862545 RepID=UPI002894010F|nr:hypothetical protein [Haloarcula sp. 1CSR25-25]MDT3434685.1 hypothetical protein [Haloarcula sp. 1CSR25-25]